MSRIAYDTFSVEISSGWEDITDSVDADDPPVTLARSDGVGALQFSLALYADGPAPNPSAEDLLEMVASFAEARDLGQPREITMESGPLMLASGSFDWSGDFLRVWQVSDGHSFAFITYTCELGHVGRELDECEQIVRSLRFEPTDRHV